MTASWSIAQRATGPAPSRVRSYNAARIGSTRESLMMGRRCEVAVQPSTCVSAGCATAPALDLAPRAGRVPRPDHPVRRRHVRLRERESGQSPGQARPLRELVLRGGARVVASSTASPASTPPRPPASADEYSDRVRQFTRVAPWRAPLPPRRTGRDSRLRLAVRVTAVGGAGGQGRARRAGSELVHWTNWRVVFPHAARAAGGRGAQRRWRSCRRGARCNGSSPTSRPST